MKLVSLLHSSIYIIDDRVNRAEKTSVLSDLIKKTNAQEMKWIVMIVLKGTF